MPELAAKRTSAVQVLLDTDIALTLDYGLTELIILITAHTFVDCYNYGVVFVDIQSI